MFGGNRGGQGIMGIGGGGGPFNTTGPFNRIAGNAPG